MKIYLKNQEIMRKDGVSCNDVAKAIYDEIEEIDE